MNKKFLEKITTVAPYLIVGVTLLVTISSLISLILSDVITGQVAGAHISTNGWFGLFVSFATTGMLIGCGALLVKFWRESNYLGFGITLSIFLSLQSADVYFDAVSVDIMRFGKIIFSSEMPDAAEAMAHNIYRFLVGGISLVGEPLAIGSLVMFPALKKFISDTLKDISFHETPQSYPYQKPVNQHRQSQYKPQHKPIHVNNTMFSDGNQKPQSTVHTPTYHPTDGQLASPIFVKNYKQAERKQGEFNPINYNNE
jgi:hypothetical protein